MPVVSAVKPEKTIADVALHLDAEEKEAMDKFLGDDENEQV